MAFKDIKGHSRAILLLQKAIISGRISYSYLFVGTESVGKKSTALNFAKVLNCKAPLYRDITVDCCEACNDCKKINSNNHPNVLLIRPEGSSIKIEQIKEIQEKIQFKPLNGKWQVIIIEQSETMTREAANSILKLLEEPPSYIVIILITTNLHLLLPTIVSRCQVFRFNLLSPALIQELLVKILNISGESASLYGSIANGRVDRAIDMSEKKELEEFRRNIIEIVSGKKGDYIWKVSTEKDKINIDKVSIYRDTEKKSFHFSSDNLSLFFEFILLWYRDLLILKELGDKKRLINIDHLGILQQEAKNMSAEELISVISIINQTKENIKKNVNIRLMIENFINNSGG
ncbi:MAG: DNA polymerase III subunit delta' [Candidatus Eremiobacterota bacterium]